MEFFTNRIVVNGPKKSFADIINEVSNKGMKKKASKDAELSEGEKAQLTPAQEKLPENLAKAIAKSNNKKKKKVKGKKKAGSGDSIKISSITPNEDGTVTLDIDEKVLATKVAEEKNYPESSDDEMDENGDEDEGDEETDDEETDDEETDDEDDSDIEDSSYVASLEAFEKEMGWDKQSASDMKQAIEGDKCGCGTNYAESKEASSVKFVKIANLTDKQKGVFRKYWSNIWPKEFIDAVLDTEN